MDETRDAPRGDAELARRTSTFASAGLSEGPTRERTMALWFANHRRVTAGTISVTTPVYWETPRERDTPQDDARESVASLTPASSLGASSATSIRDPRDRPASPDREPLGDFLARLCCRPRTRRDDAATDARQRRQ